MYIRQGAVCHQLYIGAIAAFVQHAWNPDPKPVVKLFTPDGSATWLLSEIQPALPDMAFGLTDFGMGEVELGYTSLSELSELRGKLGLPIERDRHFKATKTLNDYAHEARISGRIIT